MAAISRVVFTDYDEDIVSHFAALRRRRIRIGTQDLRIASMALAVGNILVTRTWRDFRQVPGLVLENWSAL